MDDSLAHTLDLQPAWERRSRESAFEYAWFVRYAELGPERTVQRAAQLCGVPVSGLHAARRENDWDARVAQYDAAVIQIQEASIPDESEALAIQYQAGSQMLKLGLRALQVKNPTLIKLKDIRALLTEGAEHMRRGAGIADLKIDHNVVETVAEGLELLLGPDVLLSGPALPQNLPAAVPPPPPPPPPIPEPHDA